MERIERVSLKDKTPEEEVAIIEKWMNETADKLNFALSHLDKDNFVEGQRPITEKEVQQALDEVWEKTRQLVKKNM